MFFLWSVQETYTEWLEPSLKDSTTYLSSCSPRVGWYFSCLIFRVNCEKSTNITEHRPPHVWWYTINQLVMLSDHVAAALSTSLMKHRCLKHLTLLFFQRHFKYFTFLCWAAGGWGWGGSVKICITHGWL